MCHVYNYNHVTFLPCLLPWLGADFPTLSPALARASEWEFSKECGHIITNIRVPSESLIHSNRQIRGIY